MSEIDTLVEYYVNLIIKQYHDQPNAMATIDAVVRQMLSDWVFPQVRDAFNISSAIGVQLDVLGKYAGVPRKPDGATTLNDNDMRFLIKMKILKNNTDNSLFSIQELIFNTFSRGISVSDNTDMTMTYLFAVPLTTVMTNAKLIDALPRPGGVAIILSSGLNPNGEFGFSVSGTAVSGVINGYGVSGESVHLGGSYSKSIIYG